MIRIKLLEDLYRPTPMYWLRYFAGNYYLLDRLEAEAISKLGLGVFIIKPRELLK